MTKLTLELEHEIYSVEFKNIDVDGEQYMRAILVLMIGAGFCERDALNAMDDFLTSYDYVSESNEKEG